MVALREKGVVGEEWEVVVPPLWEFRGGVGTHLQIATLCALQSLTSLSQLASGTVGSQRLQTTEQPIRLQL